VNTVAPMVASLLELGFSDTPQYIIKPGYPIPPTLVREWHCRSGACSVTLPDARPTPFTKRERNALLRMLSCRCDEVLQ